MLDTFRKLVESGDRVLRIEGCVSGTLGYVLSALEDGRAFSEAVREAVRLGYAEPDPREDLSGQDVLRKGLILARLLGYEGPVPKAESLVPPALRGIPLARFLAQMSTARRGLAPARRGREGARPRAALRRRRDEPLGPGRTALAAARVAARRPQGHAQPAVLHDPALPQRSPSSWPAPAPAPT